MSAGDNEASNKAVQEYHLGKGFNVVMKEALAVLHPVCFGGGKICRNEVWLHFHLGKICAGNYGIYKCRHKLFGQRFVWVMD